MARATMRKGVSRQENRERYAELILKNPERRVRHAALLVDNPLWPAMFEDMKKNLFEEFCIHPDLETRQRISMAVDLLDDLQDGINGYLTKGIPLKLVNTGDSDGS